MTQLLIVGGGPAALEAALRVQRLAAERVHVTILCDRDDFVYRPLAVAEPFGHGAPERFSLAAIADERGFAFRRGELRAVQPADHRVVLADGTSLGYDVLLLAVGARAEEAIPGALTFRGPEDVAVLGAALEGLRDGARVAFVAAEATVWTLPVYELALMTAGWARARDMALELWVVTWEHQPMNVFGPDVAEALAQRLTSRRVRLWTAATARSYEDGKLWVALEGGMPVELAVALPRLVGPRVRGLPTDDAGFVAVDAEGRVAGLPDVFAVGDMTTRPVKQGGLATQHADVAAAVIAAQAGADVDVEPVRPTLRAMLLTAEDPQYLRRAAREPGEISEVAPWWPPHKIAGRELAPYLALHPELRR